MQFEERDSRRILQAKRCTSILFVMIFAFIAIFTFSNHAYSDLPAPKPDANSPLTGVKQIIVWVHCTQDLENIGLSSRSDRLADVDFPELADLIKARLERSLKEEITANISLQTLHSSGVRNPFEMTDDKILLLGFSFGYKNPKPGDLNTIIGAIFPTAWRHFSQNTPPEERVLSLHGWLTSRVSPAPFLLTENEVESKQSLEEAIDRSVRGVADWLNNTGTP